MMGGSVGRDETTRHRRAALTSSAANALRMTRLSMEGAIVDTQARTRSIRVDCRAIDTLPISKQRRAAMSHKPRRAAVAALRPRGNR